MDNLKATVIDIARFICDIPVYIYFFFKSIFHATKKAILSKNKSFEGETILLTGAAAGIGKEIALQLSSSTKDLTLVLWDINESGLIKTAEECRILGAKVVPYMVDVSNREDVVKISQKVRDECGPITTLINNAGIVAISSFLDANPDMEEKVMKINFMSHLWIIREFLPDMIKRGKGHLVSTVSGLAFYRWKYISSYVASKYALRGFVETLKLEMELHPEKPDIKITAVYPGWVKTSMGEKSFDWKPRYNYNGLKPMEIPYTVEKVIEGIRKEKEEVFVPESIKLLDLLYRILPTQFANDLENYLCQNQKL